MQSSLPGRGTDAAACTAKESAVTATTSLPEGRKAGGSDAAVEASYMVSEIISRGSRLLKAIF